MKLFGRLPANQIAANRTDGFASVRVRREFRLPPLSASREHAKELRLSFSEERALMFSTNSTKARPDKGSALKVCLLVICYAAVHSLLASRSAKDYVARTYGVRARNGLYRPGYIVQSVLTTLWAIWKFQQFPDRELYRVPHPWTLALRWIRIAAATLLVSALHTVKIHRILGLPQLITYLKGGMPEPEPEAQGPALASDGRIDARGPFRFIRHPDNLPIIVLMWSFSRMTVNRLTLALLSSLYAILGSRHEDARMRDQYGKAFEDYTRKVPMLIPDGRSTGSSPAEKH